MEDNEGRIKTTFGKHRFKRIEANMFDEHDKICPVMSVNMLVFNFEFVKCMGEQCKWWKKCNKY